MTEMNSSEKNLSTAQRPPEARNHKWLTVPNALTLIRALLIPLMVSEIMRTKGHGGFAILLFFLIWSTDILDGWIARRFNEVSDVGKVLDPFVDKVFQIVTAYALFLVDLLPLWVTVFLLVKDLLMIAASAFLWERGHAVSAKWYGKAATVLFAFAFASSFLIPYGFFVLSRVLLYSAVFMGAFAWLMYAKAYQSHLKASVSKQEEKMKEADQSAHGQIEEEHT